MGGDRAEKGSEGLLGGGAPRDQSGDHPGSRQDEAGAGAARTPRGRPAKWPQTERERRTGPRAEQATYECGRSRASATLTASSWETAGASSAAVRTNGRGEEAASLSARRQKAKTAHKPFGGEASGVSPRKPGEEQKRRTCVRAGSEARTSAKGGKAESKRTSEEPARPPTTRAEEIQTLGPNRADRRADRATGRASKRRAPKGGGKTKDDEGEGGEGKRE